MEKFVRNASIVLLVICLLFLPIMLLGGIYGLAGSTSSHFVLIWIGYIGLIISSAVCLFKYKFFPAIIISIILIIIGVFLNDSFWNQHNDQLCSELRAEPSCTEDECGFTCSNFQGVGFVTGGSVCKDKDASLCREKTKRLIETRNSTK